MRSSAELQRGITRRTDALRLLAERRLAAFYSLVASEAVKESEPARSFEVRLAATP